MLVVVESPYAGDVEHNLKYARACMRDCLYRGEQPIASHLLYTQLGILNDNKPEERKQGIEAGFAWAEHAERRMFYVDLGFSRGMIAALKKYQAAAQPHYIRSIEWDWEAPEAKWKPFVTKR
jgi:hypothetical protein